MPIRHLVAMSGYYAIIALISLLILGIGVDNNFTPWMYIAIVLLVIAILTTQLRNIFPYLDTYSRRANLLYVAATIIVMLTVKHDTIVVSLILASSSFMSAIFFVRGTVNDNQ